MFPPISDSESTWQGEPPAGGHRATSQIAAEPCSLARALELVVELGRELGEAWRRGESMLAERLIARHPEIEAHPAAVGYLIQEEIRLRRERGAEVLTEEFYRRFPGLRQAVASEIDRGYPDHPGVLNRPMPRVGEALGEFRLEKLLGRGLTGSVYLARQPALADRPLVLKVTPREGREHLSLAGLQHTHVVPLLWAQDLPAPAVRVLCMPYLGGAALSALLAHAKNLPPAGRSGRALLEELDRIQAEAPVPAPGAGPARRFLAGASYARAICWIGACLADALHHAHERGLVHLDLKPSNVLIAADGTPMLLDFHLARGPIAAGMQAPGCLGGTPGYMAPEQEEAMDAARHGRPTPVVVDGRADVYGLGILLYEALAGPGPMALVADLRPRLRRVPGVSRGLVEILAKCLEPHPSDRYASASDLAADLRCHLADRPLRTARDRSLPERWAKWRRRHPRALSRAGGLAAIAVALAAAGAVAWNDATRSLRRAEAALADGQELRASGHLSEAARSLGRGLEALRGAHGLAGHVPGARSVEGRLRDELHLVRRAELVEDVHALADRVRFLHPEGQPPSRTDDLRPLESRLRAVWDARDRIAAHADGLGPAARLRVRDDLLDLALAWADLHVRLAAPGDAPAARGEALRALNEAETLLGPSPVLARECRRHAEALGRTDPAGEAHALVGRVAPPRTAREHIALGLSLERAGDLEGAAREFALGIDLEPQSVWPHFHRGVTALRLGRIEEAAHAFDVCVALAPQSPECYANRARARALLGRHQDALRDLDRTLELAPSMATALLDRGVALHRLGRHREAIEALRQALRAGAEPGVVEHNLTLAREALDACGDAPSPRVGDRP